MNTKVLLINPDLGAGNPVSFVTGESGRKYVKSIFRRGLAGLGIKGVSHGHVGELSMADYEAAAVDISLAGRRRGNRWLVKFATEEAATEQDQQQGEEGIEYIPVTARALEDLTKMFGGSNPRETLLAVVSVAIAAQQPPEPLPDHRVELQVGGGATHPVGPLKREGELDSSRAHIPTPAGSIPAPPISLEKALEPQSGDAIDGGLKPIDPRTDEAAVIARNKELADPTHDTPNGGASLPDAAKPDGTDDVSNTEAVDGGEKPNDENVDAAEENARRADPTHDTATPGNPLPQAAQPLPEVNHKSKFKLLVKVAKNEGVNLEGLASNAQRADAINAARKAKGQSAAK